MWLRYDAIKPPVQDSATAMDIFLFIKLKTILSIVDIKHINNNNCVY